MLYDLQSDQALYNITVVCVTKVKKQPAPFPPPPPHLPCCYAPPTRRVHRKSPKHATTKGSNGTQQVCLALLCLPTCMPAVADSSQQTWRAAKEQTHSSHQRHPGSHTHTHTHTQYIVSLRKLGGPNLEHVPPHRGTTHAPHPQHQPLNPKPRRKCTGMYYICVFVAG